MSLFGILNQGSRSMRTATAAVQTSSNNVANANTPGYARQSLGFSAVGTQRRGGLLVGQGVTATQLNSAYDRFSQGAVFGRMSDSSFANSRAASFQTIESQLSEGPDGGLGADLTYFFDLWSSMESDPGAQGPRLALLGQADVLSARFNNTASQLVTQQQNADARIEGTVARANVIAGQVAALNAQIVQLESAGGLANDLRANRTALLEELAGFGPVTVEDNSDGSARVLFANHVLVERDDSRALSVVADPVTGFNQVHIGQGSTSLNITGALTSGSLGADIDIRDTVLASALTQLDTLAFEVANQVNTLHNTGFGLDGITGRDFFAPPAAVAGAAQALQVDAAIAGTPDAIAAATNAAGLPGDNTNAIAIAALAGLNIMAGGTQTFENFYSSFTAGLGQDAASAYQAEARTTLELRGAKDLRDSASAVSLEEEAMDLIRFQDAYSASARIVSVTNELLQELLNIVR